MDTTNHLTVHLKRRLLKVTWEICHSGSHLWRETTGSFPAVFLIAISSTWKTKQNKTHTSILKLNVYNGLENWNKKKKTKKTKRFWHVVQLMVYETCRRSSQHQKKAVFFFSLRAISGLSRVPASDNFKSSIYVNKACFF